MWSISVLASCCLCIVFIFFFKQKTAYEMRISDWSSDVCSSDLEAHLLQLRVHWHKAFPGLRLHTLAVSLICPRFSILADDDAPDAIPFPDIRRQEQIGRASCRERVCQYV